MPVYVYETLEADPQDRTRFEIYQSIHEEALASHPETGAPVQRVIFAAAICKRTGDVMRDSNLKQNGFAKYEKQGDGTYRRTAGSDKAGPETIGQKVG